MSAHNLSTCRRGEFAQKRGLLISAPSGTERKFAQSSTFRTILSLSFGTLFAIWGNRQPFAWGMMQRIILLENRWVGDELGLEQRAASTAGERTRERSRN